MKLLIDSLTILTFLLLLAGCAVSIYALSRRNKIFSEMEARHKEFMKKINSDLESK